MVHGKIPRNSGPIYKTLKTAVLFPAWSEILGQRAMQRAIGLGPLPDRDALGPGHGAAADRRGVPGHGVG